MSKTRRKNPLNFSIDNVRRWAYLNVHKYPTYGSTKLESAALNYFGRDNIIGKILIINDRRYPADLILNNVLVESLSLYRMIYSHPNISKSEKDRLWRYTMVENPTIQYVGKFGRKYDIEKIYHAFDKDVLNDLNIKYRIINKT